MLRIGSVRWRGRCSKHSAYNPHLDGLGGIRGGCRRCEMLLGVYEAHQKLVRLMREFGTREGAKPSQSPVENRQLSLLD
ncbi:MAG: hypothetical protein H7Y20_03695 [Bryobacteraceae bacterium]|nr:hypothetical protein [Bryobacteraceae bacterium]